MAKAFYTGLPVKLLLPGQTITAKNGTETIKKKLPVDFIEEHDIESRINPMTINLQLHAGQILSALKQYKSKETFCILAVTNVDIYPRDSFNFVFGLADMTNGCGIFSFNRHSDAEWDPESNS